MTITSADTAEAGEVATVIADRTLGEGSQTTANPNRQRTEEQESGQSRWSKFNENLAGVLVAIPTIAAFAVFGTLIAVMALPVILPIAAIAVALKAADKMLTPIMSRRREKAAQRAIADAKLQRELDTINSEPQPEPEPETEAEAEAEAKPEPDPRNEREIAPGIIQYEPQDEDYSRVGGRLTDFTLAKGGPDYKPLSFAFKAVNQAGYTMGEVIGTTIWGHTQVELLHVEPVHRRHGVGKQLLALAEEFAKNAHGSRGVELWTPTFQGEGFYEKAGYEAQSRFPLNTDGYFEGAPQEHIVYYKSLEPDLIKAASEGDYQTIFDYAEKYPERVLAKLDELAETDPMLCVNLTPYYSKISDGTFVLGLEDIKTRLEIKSLTKQTLVKFDQSMRRHNEKTETRLSEALEQARKGIGEAADKAAKALEEEMANPLPEIPPLPPKRWF